MTWEQDLVVMSTRIRQMRQALYDSLMECGRLYFSCVCTVSWVPTHNQSGTPGDWNHILAQSGMFGFLNLKPEIVRRLKGTSVFW